MHTIFTIFYYIFLFIFSLTAAGYLCYLQSVHRLIAESHRLPWREKLLELSPDALVLVVLIAFVSIVFLKAYAIGIVWRCYKYLTMRQHNMRTLLPCVIPDLAGANMSAEERAYSTLLPNYDEAIAQYMKQAPPPSYQVAMSHFQADEDNAAAVDNNNDTPNNNNTVHVNANETPPSRRNNNESEAAASNEIEPPPYNVTMVDIDEDNKDDDDDDDDDDGEEDEMEPANEGAAAQTPTGSIVSAGAGAGAGAGAVIILGKGKNESNA